LGEVLGYLAHLLAGHLTGPLVVGRRLHGRRSPQLAVVVQRAAATLGAEMDDLGDDVAAEGVHGLHHFGVTLDDFLAVAARQRAIRPGGSGVGVTRPGDDEADAALGAFGLVKDIAVVG